MKSTKNDKIKEINITPSHGRSRGKTTAQYVQHLCYLPFGEEWLNQQNSAIDYKSRYTFSGKERDSETGYSYFGARYYSSDYSIWLSVDPLSDKYPNLSPYCYTANNPIKLIDPNGMDIWEVNECGKIVNVIADNCEDRFDFVDKNGKKISSSESYNAGTFTLNSNEEGKTIFTSNDNAATDNAFEFLANNTSVEWENIQTDKGTFLGSSQEEATSRIGVQLIQEGYKINDHTHNHPIGNNIASEGDHNFVVGIISKNPDATFHHYTKNNGWTDYNQYSPYVRKDGAIVYPMRPVIINAPK